MGAIEKKLSSTVSVGTTQTGLYTVPGATTAIVTELIIANKTASAATILITTSGVAIVPTKSIPANDALIIPLHMVVEAGFPIYGTAGTASAIDVYISGVELT